MMDRRTLLALAASPLLPFRNRAGLKVGDWVQMVALPSYAATFASSQNRDLRRFAWIYRRCLGGRFQIIDIGDDGRPELDVGREVAHAMGVLGCSFAIEPECVVPARFLDVLA
jgi:hypothetical protein